MEFNEKNEEKYREMMLLLENLDNKIKNDKWDGRSTLAYLTQLMFTLCDEEVFDKIINELKNKT